MVSGGWETFQGLSQSMGTASSASLTTKCNASGDHVHRVRFFYSHRDYVTGGICQEKLLLEPRQNIGECRRDHVHRAMYCRCLFSADIRIANCSIFKSCDTDVDKNREIEVNYCCIAYYRQCKWFEFNGCIVCRRPRGSPTRGKPGVKRQLRDESVVQKSCKRTPRNRLVEYLLIDCVCAIFLLSTKSVWQEIKKWTKSCETTG